MDKAVTLMVGIIFLPLGLSLLMQPKVWSDWFSHIRMQDARVALMLGCVELILGAFIVAFHSKWRGLGLIITLVGLGACLEGAFYLLFPAYLHPILVWYEARQRYLTPISGVLTIAIGLLALYLSRAVPT